MSKVGELITPTGVLVMTAEQMRADRKGWLAARRWRFPDDQFSKDELQHMHHKQVQPYGYRIGSSDVPSLFDLDGVGTPAHVWHDKVNGLEKPVTEQMRWGTLFEDVIAEEWCRRNRAVIDEIGLVAKVDEPWRQSTIDRRVRECPVVKDLTDGCGCEVKNVGYSSASRWEHDLPDRILAQIVDQLAVTGYDHMHYACNVGGNMLKQGIVWAERETKMIALVGRVVNAFRDEHLLTGVEPEWNVMDKPAKMLELDRLLHPERVGELGLDDIGLVMEYARLSRAKGDADKAMKRVQAQLAKVADGARYLTFANELAFGFRPQSRISVDVERLRERWPDAASDVIGETSYVVAEIGKDYKIKSAKPEKE